MQRIYKSIVSLSENYILHMHSMYTVHSWYMLRIWGPSPSLHATYKISSWYIHCTPHIQKCFVSGTSKSASSYGSEMLSSNLQEVNAGGRCVPRNPAALEKKIYQSKPSILWTYMVYGQYTIWYIQYYIIYMYMLYI